jgi:hypothetical protein
MTMALESTAIAVAKKGGIKIATLLLEDVKKRGEGKKLDERAAQAFRTSWEMAIERVRHIEGCLETLREFMNCPTFERQVGRIEEQFPCEPDYEFASVWDECHKGEKAKPNLEEKLRARGVYVGFFALLERGMFEGLEDVAQRRSIGRVVYELHVVRRKLAELRSTLLAIAVAGIVYAISHPALESIPALMNLGWPGVDEFGATTVAGLFSFAAKYVASQSGDRTPTRA